jgi:hypothetical protein
MPSAATSSISLCWKGKVGMIVLQNGPGARTVICFSSHKRIEHDH